MEVAQKAPYWFNVLDVDPAGVVKTSFSRKDVVHRLEVSQTYLFLCRKEKYQFGEWGEPTQCLTLLAKNHGHHHRVQALSQAEINQLDVASLCQEEVKVRDHRKSHLKYELG